MPQYMQIPYARSSSCQGFIANDYRNNDVNMRGETQRGRCVARPVVLFCAQSKGAIQKNQFLRIMPLHVTSMCSINLNILWSMSSFRTCCSILDCSMRGCGIQIDFLGGKKGELTCDEMQWENMAHGKHRQNQDNIRDITKQHMVCISTFSLPLNHVMIFIRKL